MPIRPRRISAPPGLAALLLIVLALAFAPPLEAQVVSDPRIAEFDPSPDHWTLLEDGQPAVVGYELILYVVGAPAPFATVDLGKPSPAVDGKIRYDFSKEAAAWPLPGGEYEARVSAVGPEGAALSDPSNAFTFSESPSCTYTLSTRSVKAPAGGGDYSIVVSTGTACDWTATTTLPWVSLWATHGTGSGNLPFQIPATSSTSSRNGIITIAGQTVAVSQDGATAPSTKTAPTLSWPTPANVTQGSPLSVAQLNASANVPGTFVYSPAVGTVLPIGTHTLTATFTPADTSRYTSATASRSLSVIAAASGGPTPAGTGAQVVNDAAVVADFDAALDSVRQQYLVVWHTWNAEVKGLLLNAQGQPLGSAFQIDTNALAARAAYSATRQAYLVTYTKGNARLARTVTPGAGGAAALGPAWTLGTISWIAGHGNPGGTAWVASTNSYLATWWDGGTAIRVRAVGASGPTGTATALAAADVQELPEIACGPTACLVVGRTWDQAVWGRWLNLSGVATSARFSVSSEAGTPGLARVAYSETAGTFTVAWTRGGIPQTTTLAAGATTTGTVRPVVAGRLGTQLDLAFNSGLNAFALAAQGNASDIWTQSLDSLGAPLTAAAAAISEVATTDGRPVIVANPSTRQFLLVYRPTRYTLRTRFLGGTAPGTFALTVSKTGAGGGAVTSSPVGINCGSDCSENYVSGTVVTLTAVPASGSAFTGWSGDADCSDGSVTMSAAHSCGAVFTADSGPPLGAPYTLTVTRPSGGTVKASGINCGTAGALCEATMPGPMTLALQATPDAGYVFQTWTGHCSGTSSSLALALEGPRTCGANFIAAGSGPTPAGTGTQVVNDATVVADFDAALDSVRQQYLVVWHTWNAEVKGLLLNAQGQPLGSAFQIDTNALAARATYSATRQAYLVTYTKGTARLARTVTASGGGAATVGTVWALGTIAWIAGHGNPGGTAWVASTNSYLATWWDGGTTIRVRAVGASGPTGTATALAASDVQEMPEIACGPTACLVVGRTWDQAVWGRWLNLSGVATSARFSVSSEAGTPGLTRVAYSETAGTFTVAWTRGGIPQTTTLAAGATTTGTVRPVVAGRLGTQLDLAFNSGLNAFALAAQGNASDIWTQSLDSLGAPVTATAAAISEVATTDGRPVIVANPSTRQFLLVYRPTQYTLRTRLLGATAGTLP